MTVTKTWNIEILLTEEDGMTLAHAVLHGRPGRLAEASGRARRNPRDPLIPEIGDEIAAARALSMLVHELLAAAEVDIEAATDESARVRG